MCGTTLGPGYPSTLNLSKSMKSRYTGLQEFSRVSSGPTQLASHHPWEEWSRRYTIFSPGAM